MTATDYVDKLLGIAIAVFAGYLLGAIAGRIMWRCWWPQ